MRVGRWRIGSPMRACATDARTCCAHVRAHVGARLGAPGTAPNCASPFPSALTACGSVRRLSSRCRRSTRTSACGTPRRWRTCTRYAPPSGPAARHRSGRGRARPGLRCGAAVCVRQPRRCAGVRTRVGTRLRGAVCLGMAARRRGSIHAHDYIYESQCVRGHAHVYICMGVHRCVSISS
jgi:hypothetical protein